MPDDIVRSDEPVNNMTRLPSESSRKQEDRQGSENKDISEDLHSPLEEPADADVLLQTLSPGDLVECAQGNSSGGNLAIYLRGDGRSHQLYLADGRWTFVHASQLLYHVPNFVDPEKVERVVEYLPSLNLARDEYHVLLDKVRNEDINAPRSISAPLLTALAKFAESVREVYRNHATRLDNAHQQLAQGIDLKHMDISAAAAELLGKPESSLSDYDLYATHKALSHNRFAFGIDERSHRQTGTVEIRARNSVNSVAKVVHMIHEWQEDLARGTGSKTREASRKPESHGSRVIGDFLTRVKEVILQSRKDRQPTPTGLGPSKHRFAISPTQNSVVTRKLDDFTFRQQEIIDFFRSWCLERAFVRNASLSALPPLIMQATGLYKDIGFSMIAGQVFLQELGVIPPFEGAYKYDRHLHLLTSPFLSQEDMNKNEHGTGTDLRATFVDEMADLRRDWGDLPVYCIDDAGAFEIDDGISVESGQPTSDGQPTHWLRVHVANPTAFFGPEHALARHAERMGESIYTPERAFMMMPPWTAREHFSLGENRPCMTFSARMDVHGNILERDVCASTLRKVFFITPQELGAVLGASTTRKVQTYTLTVGGMPPPGRSRKSAIPNLTEHHLGQLRLLQKLSDILQQRRRQAGGIFFEVHRPEAKVWWSWDRLDDSNVAFNAQSQRPRQYEGDPVIQTSLRHNTNWFDPIDESAKVLVRELMLLACETAASWCGDRKIPGIFRGTMASTYAERTPAQFYEEVLAPQAKETGNKFPLEMGFEYLTTFGKSGLSPKPFKHQILGLDKYGKVTSPLRRYGDMVVHWQIEAALRKEAQLGKSLETNEADPDRSFLPFSRERLKKLMTVLQPREQLITRVKQTSISYWIAQLMFRAFHFGEKMDSHLAAAGSAKDGDDLTLSSLPERLHVLITHPPTPQSQAQGRIVEFGLHVHHLEYETTGEELPEFKTGDVWRARIKNVSPVSSNVQMTLSKMLYRVGENGYHGWFGQGPRLDAFSEEPPLPRATSWGQPNLWRT